MYDFLSKKVILYRFINKE